MEAGTKQQNIFRHFNGDVPTTINPSVLLRDNNNNNTGTSNDNNNNVIINTNPASIMNGAEQQPSSQLNMIKGPQDFYNFDDSGSIFSPFDMDSYPQLIHPVDSRESQILDEPEAMDEDEDDDDDEDDNYDDVLLSSSDDEVEEDIELDDDKASIPPSNNYIPSSPISEEVIKKQQSNNDNEEFIINNNNGPPTPIKLDESINNNNENADYDTSKIISNMNNDQSLPTPPEVIADHNDNNSSFSDDYFDDEESDPSVNLNQISPATKNSRKKANSHAGPHKCTSSGPDGKPCGKIFSRPYDLIRHQDTIHAPVRKTFKCDLCGNASKTFSRMDALSRHIRVKHSK